MKRIIVNNISKKFKIGFRKKQGALTRFISVFSGKEPKKTIWALKDISFDANSGEIIGIIGKNGSGKSTLLRIIAGVYKEDKGITDICGNVISLIGLSIGLKEKLTMKDNIYLCCSLFGLNQKEIRKKIDLIVKFAELEDFINTKVYQFSQGMLQRLAFSIAIHCNPEVLLLDEVFEVGDETFKTKSINKVKKLVENGTTALLISHDLDLIKKHCSKTIWLHKGKVLKEESSEKVVQEYLQKFSNV